MGSKKPAPLPTKEQILAFLAESPGRIGKREIARAFRLGGAERIWLKRILKELQAEGAVKRGRARRLSVPDAMPETLLLDVLDTDVDGELLAKPADWHGDKLPPKIILAGPERGLGRIGVGDRVLARLRRIADNVYEAKPIRHLEQSLDQLVGVFTSVGRDGRVQPTDRKRKFEVVVEQADTLGAASGDLVRVALAPGRAFGPRRGTVLERLGASDDPRNLTLIAIHTHGIPTRFSEAALAEAKAVGLEDLGPRADWRHLPMIAIDPGDARDRDDAVWAEPDSDQPGGDAARSGKSGAPGGWCVVVAIADVAHYVRPGGALDRAARERGNSTYFPDRAVPMLPEALSGDLCSFKANRDCPTLAVRLWFDAAGRKRRHEFVRALVRPVATLEYGQVQRAQDGQPDDACRPIAANVIAPLYGAYAALKLARDQREPLAIDLPERKVVFDATGAIATVRQEPRYDSHRLVEEFMIAANVAAAETLSKRRQPCLYRVHDEPQRDKLAALRTFLATLDLRLAKGQVIKPVLFNRILAKAAGTPQAHLINTVVLRAQSQAIYAPDNIGHFGLALTKYVHFTSPIRRYADLVAHRGLLAALDIPGAGAADKGPDDAADLAAVGQHISMTERRSMTAERDALDRFMAATLMKRVGDTFMGRIDGVTHFGLFVELDETGADGLIPISAIGDDYYTHDESRHALVGRRGKRIFRLGDRVEVRLLEADPLGRGLRLELADQPPGAKPRTSGRVPARGPGRGTSGGRPPRKR